MAEIKAIETYYNGYRFRSRLEARWAVFFDALDVEYEYEPEGFYLSSGKLYLPDFKVKCWGTRGTTSGPPEDLWIEVKGKMTPEDADKIREFALSNPILIVHKIPEHGASYSWSKLSAGDRMNNIDIYPFNYELIDGDYFGAYPAADRYGHFYLWGDEGNYINDCDVPRVEKAYDLARQARFEHGEKPNL